VLFIKHFGAANAGVKINLKIVKRCALFLVVLMFSLMPLLAEEYPKLLHIISKYEFEIKGMSRESVIREMIIPAKGDPPFNSLEELTKALEDKRKKLNNLRIFEEVSYSYEAIHADDESIRYKANFFIDDAFTFLAIPYPKYDSNYGLRLGVKAYDKNLFGSFADLYGFVNITQHTPSDWDSFDWDGSIEITKIPIVKSFLNFRFGAEATQTGSNIDNFDWSGAIDWTDIPLEESFIDLHVDLAKADSSGVKYLTSTVQWRNLPWFDSKLIIRPEVVVKKNNSAQYWEADNASLYISVNPFTINDDKYILSNRFFAKFPHEYLRSTTKLDLIDANIFGMPIGFWLSSDNYFDMDSQEFYNNTYTVGTSLSRKFFKAINYRGSYEFSFRDLYRADLNHIPLFSTTQTISFGQINWQKNLRHGTKVSVTAKGEYAMFGNEHPNEDNLGYSFYTDIESFTLIRNKLELSSRISGFYSHVPSFDWYVGQTFPKFMPSGTRSASEMLRGILDKTFENEVGKYNEPQKLGVVANFDATLFFIKLGKFADGFATAFMDVGVFTQTNSKQNNITENDLIIFKTIGIEGYGIVNKFPAYPIRASLGFNLDDVIKHVKGDIGFTDIEFELTIGMGLHY
jgi:hypothetical protein